MADEHPVAKHEFQLQQLDGRVADLENQVQDLLNFRSATAEQAKTLFNTVAEIKEIISEYTKELKGAMESLAKQLNARMDELEKDMKDIKERPGRKWDDLMRTIGTVVVSLVMGYIFGVITGRVPAPK